MIGNVMGPKLNLIGSDVILLFVALARDEEGEYDINTHFTD